MVEWKGATTAYVVSWYDQSPTSATASGKNASQTDTTKQPTYNSTSYLIDFGASGYLTLPNNTFPINNNPLSIVYKYTGVGTYAGTIFYSGNGTNEEAFRTNPSMALWKTISGTTTGSGSGYTPSTGSGVEAFVYSANSVVFHQKGNATPSTTISTGANYVGGATCYLGYGLGGFAYYFGGKLSNFSIFNTALTGSLETTSSDLGIMGNI